MTHVFIDGSAGTTGLRIHQRLQSRQDISLISLPESLRKDPKAREDAINAADVAFFCLPDDAAVEAAAMVHGNTAIIDTSTAHRTAPGWDYGFAELAGFREKIAASRRVANPGCHASGFIALVQPLIQAGILSKDAALTCFSVTGYSGGGKKMIGEYESANPPLELSAPRQYGLTQKHKHLPEMVRICGLEKAPVFCPIVSDFYSGMLVTVPLFQSDIRGNQKDLADIYSSCYHGPIVHFDTMPLTSMAAANALAGRDDMAICLGGNEERILLMAFFDNLGKGASGAAIQNMNIILGLDETTGLNIGG